jgi:hypothetical protein
MALIFEHDRGCNYARESDGGHSDASRRIADGYNLHLIASRKEAVGKYLAFALADGRGDDAVYDTKADAERHQHGHDRERLYIRIRFSSMSVCEAASVLRTARMLYDLGNHQTGNRVVIPRLTNEHQARQLARLQSLVNRRR